MKNGYNWAVQRLLAGEPLDLSQFETLVDGYTPDRAAALADAATAARKRIFGNKVFIRGLIEISNYCKNDCYYCGIRKSNDGCLRYRLSETEILDSCEKGYKLGFRTFVLQGGEDGYFNDERLCSLISKIKESYSDCAITLSLGERTYDSYLALKNAGADRYLLRHETADKAHYSTLHPSIMSFEHRIECLRQLKALGFQTGCGFMVGTPGQTVETLAKDLEFIASFKPEMCGIGPFIPHAATPLGDCSAGTAEMTCYLLSIIRLISPEVLLPATTALGTLTVDGRIRGIMAGANVIMPNLSPKSAREKYEIYAGKNNKSETAEYLSALAKSLNGIGCEIAVTRGDYLKNQTGQPENRGK